MFELQRPHHWGSGIGSSPAIVEGKVYIKSLDGKVYCLNANTLSDRHEDGGWVTDIRLADPNQNQPVNRPDAACWTSPLVVNGRVYVGSGLGEDGPPTYGFIHCLDA
jgi:outer membrane protein assembly factor BamB